MHMLAGGGAAQMGVQARLMSQGLRKITQHCNKHKTTVIFLNQTRNKASKLF